MTPVEGLADGSGAVVATRLEARVPAAVAVGRADDVVRRSDYLLDPARGAIGHLRPVMTDLRVTAAARGAAATAVSGARYGGPASSRQSWSGRERDQCQRGREKRACKLDPCAGLPSPGKVLPRGKQNRQSPSSACGVSCRAGA